MKLSPHELDAMAIQLCHIRGQDPYEAVTHAPEPQGGYVCDVALVSPRWQFVRREVKDFVALWSAMNIVIEKRD